MPGGGGLARIRVSVRRGLDRLDPVARADAWRAFAESRLLVLAAAVIGLGLFPLGEDSKRGYPGLLHPFESWPLGDVFDFLLSPFIRGDAGYYLQIAHQGYTPDLGGIEGRPVFFPVYPILIRALGPFGGFGVSAVVAVAISLLCLLAALYLLHRLTELELGTGAARATVRLIAFSPVAYFFSAPYTESLFLLLSVGSIYAARLRRWALAGLLAALASGTRNVGVFVAVALVLLYLREERPWERLRPSVLWLAASPLGLVAFSLFLRSEVGDPQAWRHRQAWFGRSEPVDPITGVRGELEAAWHALDGSPGITTPVSALLDLGFLIFCLVAIVGVFRRLPLAYGAYSLAVVIPAMCVPLPDRSLTSFPRYTLVVFPLFMWLGLRCDRAGATDRVVLAFASLLSMFTAGFASWQALG